MPKTTKVWISTIFFVSEIKVDESFILKRIQARARGRADRIQKRSCHVNITLGSEKN